MPNPADDKGSHRGEISPEDRAAFKRRASELGEKLGEARGHDDDVSDAASTERGRAMGRGFRMATDLVAAVLVGGAIGYFLDRWLDTAPWLLLVFLVLGIAAGARNVARTYKAMQAEYLQKSGGNLGKTMLDDD
jgi:ATP synthase protein I